MTFQGHGDATLDARLDYPAGQPKAFALFAHCFTCSKDIFAASRIAGALAEQGIVVLRFDFTGLGSSKGEFANTNFSSNMGDLRSAAAYLRENHEAPSILIGHSLGGAAVLAAAGDVPKAVGSLGEGLLVFHAPLDATVGVGNAGHIFQAANHPKSFVSLDDADHLLSRRADAIYVANVIAAWTERYIDSSTDTLDIPAAAKGTVVVAETGTGRLAQVASFGGQHVVTADEPKDYGGDDTGGTPYDLLLAGLGACTNMTIHMYSRRKKSPLTGSSCQ